MASSCFCDWPENIAEEARLAELEEDRPEDVWVAKRDRDFIQKIRSINFSRVKGGARGGI